MILGEGLLRAGCRARSRAPPASPTAGRCRCRSTPTGRDGDRWRRTARPAHRTADSCARPAGACRPCRPSAGRCGYRAPCPGCRRRPRDSARTALPGSSDTPPAAPDRRSRRRRGCARRADRAPVPWRPTPSTAWLLVPLGERVAISRMRRTRAGSTGSGRNARTLCRPVIASSTLGPLPLPSNAMWRLLPSRPAGQVFRGSLNETIVQKSGELPGHLVAPRIASGTGERIASWRRPIDRKAKFRFPGRRWPASPRRDPIISFNEIRNHLLTSPPAWGTLGAGSGKTDGREPAPHRRDAAKPADSREKTGRNRMFRQGIRRVRCCRDDDDRSRRGPPTRPPRSRSARSTPHRAPTPAFPTPSTSVCASGSIRRTPRVAST